MLDFDSEWERLQRLRARPDNAQHWDQRAPRFDTRDAKNLYAEAFIDLMGIKPRESVFDMGCGTGALAAPLAEAGHGVIAADFSAGMQAKLRENMALRGLCELAPDNFTAQDAAPAGIAPLHMSWEDNWERFGLREGMVDVAIASRSIAVADLRAALGKLNDIARRRCCITLTTGTSPRVDPAILKAIGVPLSPSRDFIYAFGILAQAGLEPDVRYIHSPRKDTFDSLEEAFDDFSAMIRLGSEEAEGAFDEQAARARLRAWLEQHVVANSEAGVPDKKGVAQKALTLDSPRIISWAFISWNTVRGALDR